jgi:erythronate-4-phosphate dehydrogenase
MKRIIIADDKIPFLKGVLEPCAEVIYMPGEEIRREHLAGADALLIRTRTRCNEELLHNTRIQFIGTATIGFDHIDTGYCESRGIEWKNAPGCNAGSVNQYVMSVLAHLSRSLGFSLKDRVLGVVGVGNVGTRVVTTAEQLGMRVYLCDPPRVRNEGICGFLSLEGIIRECDIITFHVPLNDETDRTRHLIDRRLLESVNEGTVIINTSRGEVADGIALKEALDEGKIGGAVLDVWENEPLIDTGLLDRCVIGTPHIAGYSVDGKARGTAMIIQELSRHFGLGLNDWEPDELPVPPETAIRIPCNGLSEEEILLRAIEATYRVAEDDKRLRLSPSTFEMQRGNYPLRREFRAYNLDLADAGNTVKRIFRRMGFHVI